MKPHTGVDNILSNHNFFLESKNYIEDKTNLFMVDFLGFPWYKVAIERILNLGSSVLPNEDYDEQQKAIRLNDFHKKNHYSRSI
ncbi:hypothetical protein [Solidesulfovibrio magneticus]|uniref:Uncharacterized protein n=1 Tax=Solidesulfovibrio magneticus (strain ATCC 700980 / DSM 13731 / RS-1) TaxID=573370 RepID=C4XP47_SOLM1|nr:hypothetical protein [Solidesulfovibrio magneticus]BAH77548.1 hypothetical protein DMR_40570 [Solidesulfovibrio magneticus RS-1]